MIAMNMIYSERLCFNGGKMKIITRYFITAIILFTSIIVGQTHKTPVKTDLGVDNSFAQDFLNYKTEKDGQTKVEAFIQVPYNNIKFIKSDDGFLGRYTITLSFFDEKGEKLFAEKIWNEKIFIKDYKTTTSRFTYNISRKTFTVRPGMYVIRTAIADKETKKELVKTLKFNVHDFSNEVDISSILFIENNNSNDISKTIVPNVTRNVANQHFGVPIYYEIYSNKKDTVSINYKISDKEEEDIFTETVSSKIDSGVNHILYTAKDTTISLGTYQFEISISNSNNEMLAQSKKLFISRWAGAPTNIEDLEAAIDQLEYIASDEQIDYINEGKTKEEKIKRYREFWKSKDPNPADEDNEVFNEYYRRINLANINFSHYNSPGWRTDRGMVYIVLGPPNNIENHPFDSYNKPYVVWEYYDLLRNFTFVDVTGFGDYRLANPLDFDYYRYR